MKKYMKQDAITLMWKKEFGIGNKKSTEISEIINHLYNKVVFTNENGLQGNEERLNKINLSMSVHNNNIELRIGNDVRKGEVDYTYIFGCPSMNFIRLIGYFKNIDLLHNLVKKEYVFDIGSLKDFIYDRSYNYLNELETEDEWMGNFEYQKEFEEMEAELE